MQHQQQNRKRTVVIIPAFNEENSIGLVLNDIPADLVDEVVVVDNASTDATANRVRAAGATLLYESRKGYGSACLKGLEYALSKGYDIFLFLDADYSDHPEEAERIIRPILEDGYDMVIGSRAIGAREAGAMLPQARFGNWLATRLIRLFWGYRYTDLGPFRGITAEALRKIEMEDTNYGWTVEMQIKAARLKLKTTEVPVSYRKRIGTSKISGTLSGTIKAGWKILYTIAKYSLSK
ncbi:MAG: glycosyltransferase family 2 protein [Ignavibacteriae bacterium]|nr:glycosyltransferase family 2 protein [Ignavibacteriota bacterium]MCB9217329.1 glycosyltransferase family 2 protein [Ignavibacteria bacterium]